MITLRKLRQLPAPTRLRKIVRLLDGFVQYRSRPDDTYLEDLVELVRTDPGVVEAGPVDIPNIPPRSEDDVMFRYIDDLRYLLRTLLNIPVGDWDLFPPAGFGVPGEARDVTRTGADVLPPAAFGPDQPRDAMGLYLESIRSPFNAGNLIRSAVALGVTRICMSPDCPPADHPRLVRTSRGAEATVPIVRAPLGELGPEWQPFLALEVGGQPVDTFRFPVSGTLIVGSEELGLSPAALEAADETVSVRMTEVKGSMNVGVACGIALHAWYVQAQVTDPGD